MNPFVNPSRRSISLPNDCKDPVDVMDDNLARERADAFGTEFLDLREVKFTSELLRCIPAATARKYRVLPIFDGPPNSLTIALADPCDLEAIDYLAHTLRRDLDIRIASSRQLEEFVQRLYGGCEA